MWKKIEGVSQDALKKRGAEFILSTDVGRVAASRSVVCIISDGKNEEISLYVPENGTDTPPGGSLMTFMAVDPRKGFPGPEGAEEVDWVYKNIGTWEEALEFAREDLRLPVVRVSGSVEGELYYLEDTEGRELGYWSDAFNAMTIFGRVREVRPDMRAPETLWLLGDKAEESSDSHVDKVLAFEVGADEDFSLEGLDTARTVEEAVRILRIDWGRDVTRAFEHKDSPSVHFLDTLGREHGMLLRGCDTLRIFRDPRIPCSYLWEHEGRKIWEYGG